jgi:hypothetical protein
VSQDGKGEATARNKQTVGSTEKIDKIMLQLVHSNSIVSWFVWNYNNFLMTS